MTIISEANIKILKSQLLGALLLYSMGFINITIRKAINYPLFYSINNMYSISIRKLKIK